MNEPDTTSRTGGKRWPPKAKPLHARHGGIELDVPAGVTPVLESPHANVVRAHGPMAYLNAGNTLSTPVIVMLMLGFLVCGLGVGYAVSRANAAVDRAALAEREGRLAEEAAMHLRSTMRAYGIALNPSREAGLKNDTNDEEPIEP